ncbi:chaperone protein dnaJ 8, chloroplastic-like [Cucurbita moschata]|uniref:Chaperone protein dnaJ 8, chloroplastic-like n=1 Tax=Cucurbita moschata TaxID=3662 RepID=A0A6J1F1M8_CUCMO|nr:chaperone protein dnaJ 8, chloroplastic-like [Cucurbita moschata]
MASVATAGISIARTGSSSSSSSFWIRHRNRSNKDRSSRNRVRVTCSSSLLDPYQTLRIQPGASESEVKKAFRRLALQYHPDVCRGSNCGVQFHQINEAYDIVMNNLRGISTPIETRESCEEGVDEEMRGMDDPDWELWEEWMGWEGAGIRDYSSHINPYI